MYKAFGKRLFDVLACAGGLVVLAPLLALVALAVRIRLGGPVLFKQRRPGLKGAPFTILKFRTMVDPKPGQPMKGTDAERTPPFGRWLRRSSMDELPELWNVLMGDMSLVGPRPLLMEYLEKYTPEQARRHDVRPGVTGWAQINGRNDLSWPEKFKLDVWYVDNLGFLLDVKILILTVGKVLRPSGIVVKEGFKG